MRSFHRAGESRHPELLEKPGFRVKPGRTEEKVRLVFRHPRRAGKKDTCVDMFRTCMYPAHMPRMIQIRNVPDSLHRTLKARAALEGMSLSDYLMAEIRRIAERPTTSELRERLKKRTPVNPRIPPHDAVREEREAS